jgi:hypothetical protein
MSSHARTASGAVTLAISDEAAQITDHPLFSPHSEGLGLNPRPCSMED